MAQEKTTTMADGTVSKVTALPEGCTLALFDSSGGVSKIDAQKFMELVRGSIQIGGRNLIPNSKQISVPATSKDYSYIRLRENLNVKTGDLLTASVGSIKGTGAQEQIAFLSIYNQLTNITIARFVLKPDAKSATSTVSADCDNAQVLLYTGIPGDNAGKSLEVTELKLERGNIATDWMPAPEDFGGVKSPYTQSVTRLYLQQQLKLLTIQRKGGRHERRQNNTLRGCGQSTPETLNTRRIVSPVRGCRRGTEEVGCESAGKKESGFKRPKQWQLRGYIQSDGRCTKHPGSTRRIQPIRPNCLSRAKFIRSTDIYSVACGEYRKDFHTSMYQRFLGHMGLHGSHKVYLTTTRRKEVVAA